MDSLDTISILIVSSQVLLGKFADENTPFIQKWARELGLDVIETRVVRNDRSDISCAIDECCRSADLLVVAGGIGPGVDDVTYESIASSVNLECAHHESTWDRMVRLSNTTINNPEFSWTIPSPKLVCKQRMAYLPVNPNDPEDVQVFHPLEEEWTPLVLVQNRILIAPGTPSLLQKLLVAFGPQLRARIPVSVRARTSVSIKTTQSETDFTTILVNFNEREYHNQSGVFATSCPDPNTRSTEIIVTGPNKDIVVRFADEICGYVDGCLVGASGDTESATGENPVRAVLQRILSEWIEGHRGQAELTPETTE